MKNTYFFIITPLLLIANPVLPTSSVAGNNKQVLPEKKQVLFTQSQEGNGMRFTPNNGQIADMNGQLRPDILYKGEACLSSNGSGNVQQGAGADIYLRETGISYVYSNINEVRHEVHEIMEKMDHSKKGFGNKTKEKWEQMLMQKQTIKIHRVDMDFANCNQNITTTTEDELEGYTNYYYANCPQGITHVKQYNKVTCKNIYNNIDVSYYAYPEQSQGGGQEHGLKYDIIVQPYSDPNQINLHWKGAESIHLNREGSLVIKTSVNEFYESIPKVYQIINGEIVDVKAKYVLTPVSKGEAIINFSFSNFNSSFPLVIDPWATYYGGNDWDSGKSITTDNTGNVCITGHTWSANFPIFAGGGFIQASSGGKSDAYVVKFNSNGVRLWASYYGGSSFDSGYSIATDNAGNILITGNTSSANFPVFAGGGYSQAFGGADDAFIIKFNPAGIRLWASYYGGNSWDQGYGIATDNTDNIFITGSTSSANFPLFAGGGYSQVYGGSQDAFIVKFNNTGVRLWASYYGGSSWDYGYSIATDNASNVLITGSTNSVDFPVLSGGGYIQAYGGGIDAFIVKFSSIGTRIWATYYGGSIEDNGLYIATDNADNVLITGYTNSINLPVLSGGGYIQVYGGGNDAFIVKFNNTGVRFWASFYGGNQSDWAWGIATDVNNNIYLLIEEEDTPSPALVADACSYQPVFNGGSSINIPGTHVEIEDLMIVKFSPTGKKLCATYMGGTGEEDLDLRGGIAIYGNSLYITGSTDGGFPVTTGAYQTVYGGGQFDAFVISLCANICEGKVLGLNYTVNTTTVCENAPVTFTPFIVNSCDTSGYKFLWTFTGGNPSSSNAPKVTVTFPAVGTHDVKLVVTTVCKKDSIAKSSYITVTSCGITAIATGAAICSGNCGTVTSGGSSGTTPYTYSWSNGATTQNTSPCPASTTTYTVTITDSGGLTATSTTVVTVNPIVTVTATPTSITCNGGNDGSVIANPASGTSPYTYSWSNGGTTSQISNLSSQIYTVTITDSKGCTSISAATITTPTPLVAQFAKGMANCAGCSCKEWIMVNAAGGTSPYSYLWIDGYDKRYKNQLCSGIYIINIKDKKGCSVNVSVAAP